MALLQQASRAIHAAGGRFTPQRRLIIELLETADEHLSAEAVYQMVQQHDPGISQATVYRTLNILEEAGLIDQHFISRAHTQRYFEPLNIAEHYHFVCQRCHQVIEFETDLVQEIGRMLGARFGALVEHACVCFDGLCAQCQTEEGV